MAQDAPKEEGFVFTTVKENPITSIKNQNRSSTCWSFSSLGFLESELLRMGKGEYDLSEMFVVHHTMVDRGQNYVRYHGDSSFSPGGSFYDIMFCLKNYGLVPQEAMPGIMYGDSLPVHNELDAVAGAYVDAIAKGRLTKLTPVWKNGLSAIYDTYLGKCPEKFTYKGKEYTPKTFGESLGINPDDYVSLTSYTHHPFYTQFAIEIQDNWRNGLSWNLPIDELMAVMDNAIKNGYTFAWGSDVSEQGFTRDGIAVMPMQPAAQNSPVRHGSLDRPYRCRQAQRADRQTAAGSQRYPGNASDCFRQLGNNRRPRHGYLWHCQGPERKRIFHGKEFLGTERQV